MLVVFGPPQVFDVAPDAVPTVAVLFRQGQAAFAQFRFIGFINHCVIGRIEVEFQALGEIPLQVVVTPPEESFVEERAVFGIQIGKAVFGSLELSIHQGAKGEGAGDWIKVEFRDQLKCTSFELFQRLNVLGLGAELVIDSSIVFLNFVTFDKGIAAFCFCIPITQ